MFHMDQLVEACGGLFRYRSGDTLETILAPRYFDMAASRLRTGDVIFVVSDDPAKSCGMDCAVSFVVVNDHRGVQTRDVVVPIP